MKQIIYAMQFNGSAVPANEAGDVLKASTKAGSCNIRSVVGDGGLSGVVETVEGGTAYFESEVAFTGDATFLESGSIRFGEEDDTIFFSTIGQGHLGDAADTSLKHGAVVWNIDRGEGRFEGASGLITSNFTVGSAGEVVDNQFGVMFVN